MIPAHVNDMRPYLIKTFKSISSLQSMFNVQLCLVPGLQRAGPAGHYNGKKIKTEQSRGRR